MSSSSSEVSVHRATRDDAAGVAAVGRNSWTAAFGHSVTPEQRETYANETYNTEAMVKQIEDPNTDVLVAKDIGGRAVGMAVLLRESDDPCLTEYSSKIELLRYYVDPAAQGMGVGKALMNAADDIAREQGYQWMWLGVWEEATKSQQIYTKLGFQHVGYHMFDVSGDQQQDHVMIKKL